MRNIVLVLVMLTANTFASELIGKKINNFKFNLENYSELIRIETVEEFCTNIEKTIPKLHEVLNEDEALIRFLVSTGNNDDYNYAGTINTNKLSNLFYYMNKRDACFDGTIDLNGTSGYIRSSMVNSQFLQKEFLLFAKGRGYWN